MTMTHMYSNDELESKYALNAKISRRLKELHLQTQELISVINKKKNDLIPTDGLMGELKQLRRLARRGDKIVSYFGGRRDQGHWYYYFGMLVATVELWLRVSNGKFFNSR